MPVSTSGHNVFQADQVRRFLVAVVHRALNEIVAQRHTIMSDAHLVLFIPRQVCVFLVVVKPVNIDLQHPLLNPKLGEKKCDCESREVCTPPFVRA
jgi:hypothetical protein